VTLHAVGTTAVQRENGIGKELLGSYLPWLERYNPWLTGFKSKKATYSLFDRSILRDIPISPSNLANYYFMEMFFRRRYMDAEKNRRSGGMKAASSDSLSESWDAFITAMKQNPSGWLKKLKACQEAFGKCNCEGAKMRSTENLFLKAVFVASSSALCATGTQDRPRLQPA
jgi:hypothetical protein